MSTSTEQTYCAYCTKKLILPYFAVVQNADGLEVRVHKNCADRAAAFWKPLKKEIEDLPDGRTLPKPVEY